MLVTPEVSQFERSALKLVKSLKSSFMFVTAVTPQMETGPYAAMAVAAEAPPAFTCTNAVLSAEKSANAGGGEGGGGEGGGEGG